ncbi:hypothetical protein CIPAW_01G237300 [Carya illinoinensis]|uniref:Uncharacterized protein n=1 Tax=Carya illinoinensis TaxID=32201 RepID=A0A8T1RRG5_CARIL|nr:hypothetical protein CIPAW_01G237300 [Carya illinoinensis]
MRLVAQRNEHAEAAGVGSGTRRRSEEADCGSGHMRRWIVVPHVLLLGDHGFMLLFNIFLIFVFLYTDLVSITD